MDYTGDGARVGTKSSDGGPAVTEGGPGDRAGLEAGDVITEVDGRRIHSGDELIVKTRAHRPGDRLELTVERDGRESPYRWCSDPRTATKRIERGPSEDRLTETSQRRPQTALHKANNPENRPPARTRSPRDSTGRTGTAGTVDPARTTEDPHRPPRAEDRGHRKELQVFNDIGPLELITLVVLAVLVFGPDKLPKVIQDVMRTVRKIREFSESAKQDIRSELGPEFKDFEFEDLNPKTFIRKQLDNDELGLKEIRNGFDLKKEMAEVTDSVHSTDTPAASSSGGRIDMTKKPEEPGEDNRPPFDADAT